MSPKQQVVLFYLSKNESITLATACELIGKDIYCNEEKHCGAILSNMVKRKMIERIKPGVFTKRDLRGENPPPTENSTIARKNETPFTLTNEP